MDAFENFVYMVPLIDGYSRLILWLEVAMTNNNPGITTGSWWNSTHCTSRYIMAQKTLMLLVYNIFSDTLSLVTKAFVEINAEINVEINFKINVEINMSRYIRHI